MRPDNGAAVLPCFNPIGFTMSDHGQNDDLDLDRFGIERVVTETFRWKGYRYTHARDAIAAAKRDERITH